MFHSWLERATHNPVAGFYGESIYGLFFVSLASFGGALVGVLNKAKECHDNRGVEVAHWKNESEF